MLLSLAVAVLTRGTPNSADLDVAVKRARLATIVPRQEAPAWMDYEKVRGGYALMRAHGSAIARTLATASLAATFAARDTTPVVIQTGRLPHEFTTRMKETEARMFMILLPAKDREAFVKGPYARAVALGDLHAEVAEEVRKPLNWDPKVRVPMNGQAYALVLYSFSYWPVQALIAQKALDPVAQAKAIDDWFYLWAVIGYGMGVPDALLPHDYASARTLVGLVKRAQFPRPGERPPDGVPLLLGNQVRMIAETSKVPLPEAAKALAETIALAPGDAEALGLGSAPAVRLAEYAAKISGTQGASSALKP